MFTKKEKTKYRKTKQHCMELNELVKEHHQLFGSKNNNVE